MGQHNIKGNILRRGAALGAQPASSVDIGGTGINTPWAPVARPPDRWRG